MIIVGIGQGQHDSNISAYINGNFKYAKYERECGIKYSKAPLTWYLKKIKDWGIEEHQINAFCYVDDWEAYPTYTKLPLPLDGSDFLLKSQLNMGTVGFENGYGWHGFCNHISENNYVLLDHHVAHVYSNLGSNKNSKAVVSDNGGSGGKISLVKNSMFGDFRIDPKQNLFLSSSASVLNALGRRMGLEGLVNDIPGKLMGLQAYGESIPELVEYWKSRSMYQHIDLEEEIMSLKGDAYANNKIWCDYIKSIFDVLYHTQLSHFKGFSKKEKIIYSGGVAHNVCWNRKLLDEGYNLDLQPQLNDEALSIGCVRFMAERLGVEINNIKNFPYIQDDESTTKVSDHTVEEVSEYLAQGKVVGWYQGHGEIGSRALGNRSILMNPSIKNGKDIINEKVKHREWWRPFGASVKKQDSHKYFDLEDSPYMLYTSNVLVDGMDSITHIDGTCRHQTVTEDQNEDYYHLLDEYEKRVGHSVVLNTSLNLGGKPIAGNIQEAIKLFKTSDMDILCVGDKIYKK